MCLTGASGLTLRKARHSAPDSRCAAGFNSQFHVGLDPGGMDVTGGILTNAILLATPSVAFVVVRVAERRFLSFNYAR